MILTGKEKVNIIAPLFFKFNTNKFIEKSIFFKKCKVKYFYFLKVKDVCLKFPRNTN